MDCGASGFGVAMLLWVHAALCGALHSGL